MPHWVCFSSTRVRPSSAFALASASSISLSAVMSLEIPQVPMISPSGLAQRHLGCERPLELAVRQSFFFDLADDRFAGSQNLLLVLECLAGVFPC